MSTHTLVLGDGGWGQALAMSLHRAGRPVVVWSYDAEYAAEVAKTRENRKFLPDVEVPQEISRRQRKLITELAQEIGDNSHPQQASFIKKLRGLFDS